MSGSVFYNSRLATEPFHRRSRAGLAFIPETRAIVRKLTVRENLRLSGGDLAYGFELFPELYDLKSRRAGLLSGGEQQMLVFARVLTSGPRLMLIDELSFGLAPKVVQRLLAALRVAADRDGAAVLLVEQHPVAALSTADRACVLANGRIQLEGDARSMKQHLGDIEDAYLSAPASRSQRDQQGTSDGD
jgi:branched-chain amino acid transport system ATP-binding protein